MKYKLIIIIFISGLFFQSCNYFKKHRLFSKKVDTIQEIKPEIQQEPVIDTTVYSQPAVEEPVKTAENTNTSKQINDFNASSGKRYFMIVGSFLDQKNAERYAQKLQNMGYTPEIINDASNGFHRVSARSYDNFKTGISEIPEFRSSVATKAWVHVKK
jgi:cell division protein FtsN